MRYLTGVLRPVERIHPVERALAESSSLTPVAIHQTKLLDDDTCITLMQVRGDRTVLHELLSSQPAVIDYSFAGEQEVFVYLQSEPHDLGKFVLGLQAESDLIVELPMNHTGDGGIRATLIGTDASFQRAVESLPGEFDLELERMGEYRPGTRDVFSTLTDRQKEILSTAIRNGYYEYPRRSSLQEIAEYLDIAAGTVGQHLQRIEAKVFSEFMPAARS